MSEPGRCAMIGTVAQYLMDYVDRERYEADVQDLRRQLSRFNRDGADGTAQLDRVKAEEEYRFMLCRHWNVHDSMAHSRYVASRLQLWRDRGWRRLSELLASMGVPLDACKRDWFVMERGHRDQFTAALKQWAPRFGLGEVRFPSFLREVGYELATGLTAGDAFYAVSAILESPLPFSPPSDPAPFVDRHDLLRGNFSAGLQALDLYPMSSW